MFFIKNFLGTDKNTDKNKVDPELYHNNLARHPVDMIHAWII